MGRNRSKFAAVRVTSHQRVQILIVILNPMRTTNHGMAQQEAPTELVLGATISR
jgi:hypothetical protein